MYEVELRIIALVVIRDVGGQAHGDAPLVRWAEAAVRPRVRARRQARGRPRLRSKSKQTSAVGGATSISILAPWLGVGFESGFESEPSSPPPNPPPPSRNLRRKLTLTWP